MRVMAEAPGTPRVGVGGTRGQPTELAHPARSTGATSSLAGGASEANTLGVTAAGSCMCAASGASGAGWKPGFLPVWQAVESAGAGPTGVPSIPLAGLAAWSPLESLTGWVEATSM